MLPDIHVEERNKTKVRFLLRLDRRECIPRSTVTTTHPDTTQPKVNDWFASRSPPSTFDVVLTDSSFPLSHLFGDTFRSTLLLLRSLSLMNPFHQTRNNIKGIGYKHIYILNV